MTRNPRGWLVFRGNLAFTRLWWSQTVSGFGSQVTFIAIPLLAATSLGADAFQMGLLAAVETMPYLAFSIPAGVLVDRADRRSLLLISNVGRAIVLVGIPAAALLGYLSLPLLYAVAFGLGTLSVVSDVAHQSYVPELLERDDLLSGNQRLELSESAARTIGPGIGGALVAAVGSAMAVTVDAASYLIASVLLLGSRRPKSDERPSRDEPGLEDLRPAPSATAPESPVGMILDVWEYVARLDARVADLEARLAGRSLRARAAGALIGFRIVGRDRVLRDVAASTATFNLASSAIMAVFVLFAAKEVGMDAAGIGILIAAGNIGFVLGALPVGAITARLGVGPTLVISGLLGAAATMVLPFAVGAAAVPALFVGRFVGAVGIPLFNVNARALRQSRAPLETLGRVNAVFRLLDWGALPIGALLGGAIGSVLGLRAALTVGAILGIASAIILIVSPLRSLQRLEGTVGRTPDAPMSAERVDRGGAWLALSAAGVLLRRPLAAVGRLPNIRWWGLAVAGALLQLMLFLPPVNARLAAASPWIYILSTVAVLVCVLRNARVPGLAITALGGASNLLAIVANGGSMPVSPDAARMVGHGIATSYTNTIELAHPFLQPLTDIIVVPNPLPFANVYSIGDLLVATGVAVTVAWALHGSVTPRSDAPDGRSGNESLAAFGTSGR